MGGGSGSGVTDDLPPLPGMEAQRPVWTARDLEYVNAAALLDSPLVRVASDGESDDREMLAAWDLYDPLAEDSEFPLQAHANALRNAMTTPLHVDDPDGMVRMELARRIQATSLNPGEDLKRCGIDMEELRGIQAKRACWDVDARQRIRALGRLRDETIDADDRVCRELLDHDDRPWPQDVVQTIDWRHAHLDEHDADRLLADPDPIKRRVAVDHGNPTPDAFAHAALTETDGQTLRRMAFAAARRGLETDDPKAGDRLVAALHDDELDADAIRTLAQHTPMSARSMDRLADRNARALWYGLQYAGREADCPASARAKAGRAAIEKGDYRMAGDIACMESDPMVRMKLARFSYDRSMQVIREADGRFARDNAIKHAAGNLGGLARSLPSEETATLAESDPSNPLWKQADVVRAMPEATLRRLARSTEWRTRVIPARHPDLLPDDVRRKLREDGTKSVRRLAGGE